MAPQSAATRGGVIAAAITRFNRRLGDSLAYGYFIVFVLTFGEVLSRYLFNAPTQWTLEVCLILAGLHYILCGPQVTADDGHIAVTTLTDTLSARAQRIAKTFGVAISFCCCLVLVVGAWKQAAFSFEVNERSGTIFNSRMPMILKVALVSAFALMALQLLVNFLKVRRA